MSKEKDVEEFYDRYLLSKSYPYEEYRHNWIDDFIVSRVKASDRLLDMGCGTGKLLGKLRNRELYGCDISKKALSLVAKRAKTRRVNLEKRLPYKSAFFDCVVLREVIEHIESRSHLMGEINRILKKGGRLIVTTPNRHSTVFIPYFVLKRFAMQPVEEWLSRKQAEQMLQQAGFHIEEFSSIFFVPWHGFLPKIFIPLIKRVDPLLKNMPGNRSILFVAKKV
ncbi:MAG: class I SAM-dependent methyltransferase [Candidatus Diapherotrites archaeon]|nr:class I SAM-dependent methyltransferase [Candidatus Diapherotrites archaeon]